MGSTVLPFPLLSLPFATHAVEGRVLLLAGVLLQGPVWAGVRVSAVGWRLRLVASCGPGGGVACSGLRLSGSFSRLLLGPEPQLGFVFSGPWSGHSHISPSLEITQLWQLLFG